MVGNILVLLFSDCRYQFVAGCDVTEVLWSAPHISVSNRVSSSSRWSKMAAKFNMKAVRWTALYPLVWWINASNNISQVVQLYISFDNSSKKKDENNNWSQPMMIYQTIRHSLPTPTPSFNTEMWHCTRKKTVNMQCRVCSVCRTVMHAAHDGHV